MKTPEIDLLTFIPKWQDALRSKRYRQGRGFLCQEPVLVDGDGTYHMEYCCIGVATNEAGLMHRVDEMESCIPPSPLYEFFPESVWNFLGYLNDTLLWSFEDIAMVLNDVPRLVQVVTQTDTHQITHTDACKLLGVAIPRRHPSVI